MTRRLVFLPPLAFSAVAAPWIKSVALAAALGAAASVGLAATTLQVDRADDEFGAEMIIEIAPVVSSAASLASTAAMQAEADDRPATPDVDEAQSKKVERDLPTEQASPVPPDEEDLRMAQERTQRESETAAEEEQATEAMKSQTQIVSSQSAAASEPSTGAPDSEVARAPDHGNSATGQRRIAEWQRRLFGHIARHKTYPEAARRTRESGEALLAFRISRDGALSGVRVIRSSGHPVLDSAALDVMRRASPVPALPRDLRGDGFEFSLPMRFTLK